MLFGAMFLYPDGINPDLILLAICVTGLIVGFAWIRRTVGPDPDKEPSFWRYRQVDKIHRPSKVHWLPTAGDALMDLNEFMAESNARARRGRRLSREIFGAALLTPAVVAFLFIAAPNGPTAMFADPGPIRLIVPGIGVLGIVVGLIWMVRILRAHHEPEAKGWRYRDF